MVDLPQQNRQEQWSEFYTLKIDSSSLLQGAMEILFKIILKNMIDTNMTYISQFPKMENIIFSL